MAKKLSKVTSDTEVQDIARNVFKEEIKKMLNHDKVKAVSAVQATVPLSDIALESYDGVNVNQGTVASINCNSQDIGTFQSASSTLTSPQINGGNADGVVSTNADITGSFSGSIGTSTATNLTVIGGALGSDLNAQTNKITNLGAAQAGTDAAQLDQTSIVGGEVSRLLVYDIVTDDSVSYANNKSGVNNTSTAAAPLDYATLFKNVSPPGVAEPGFLFTGLEPYAANPTTQTIIIASVAADLDNFVVGDLVRINNTNPSGNTAWAAGVCTVVRDIIKTGPQVGIVIDLVPQTGTGNGSYFKSNTVTLNSDYSSGFLSSVEYLGPSDISTPYLGIVDTFSAMGVASAPLLTTNIITDNTAQQILSRFIRISGTSQDGVYNAVARPSSNEITIDREFLTSEPGNYEFVIPTLVVTYSGSVSVTATIDFQLTFNGDNVVGNTNLVPRVFYSSQGNPFVLLGYPQTLQRVYTSRDYTLTYVLSYDFVPGDRILFSVNRGDVNVISKPSIRAFAISPVSTSSAT